MLYGVGSKPALGAFDDAIQLVYYFHNAYVMTDGGYGAHRAIQFCRSSLGVSSAKAM